MAICIESQDAHNHFWYLLIEVVKLTQTIYSGLGPHIYNQLQLQERIPSSHFPNMAELRSASLKLRRHPVGWKGLGKKSSFCLVHMV